VVVNPCMSDLPNYSLDSIYVVLFVVKFVRECSGKTFDFRPWHNAVSFGTVFFNLLRVLLFFLSWHNATSFGALFFNLFHRLLLFGNPGRAPDCRVARECEANDFQCARQHGDMPVQ
ncbi:MAG: hypothetical protein II547_07645, partial [Treponema sp.]|nr:hypothetical protein [Treponema sp.]